MTKDQATLFISIAALLFTTFSFWWMNWRRGHLKVSNVRTYAAHSSNGKVLVELPLIFYNTGALPILIENLRLNISSEGEDIITLFFNATVAKLAKDEDRSWATPFAVHGGKAMELICEFQEKSDGFTFGVGDYSLKLEAIMGHKKGWRTLRKLVIRVGEADSIMIAQMLKACDNRLENI